MIKSIFITGTGTDIGKTYITALIIKTLRENGFNCGYYKAAISGANNIQNSDAGYVNKIAKINQKEETLVSYLYKTPVAPHLASQIEGNPVNLNKIKTDFKKVCDVYSHVVVEGSGGIVCPIRFDKDEKIMLIDIIKLLKIPLIIIANAGLGTINSTVLTIEYLKQQKIPIVGIILNRFNGSQMQKDNIKMIENLTNIKIIGTVNENGDEINLKIKDINLIFI